MAGRKSIDCRDYPSEKNCSLEISGTEEEVLDAAVQHAVSAHGQDKTPELRSQLRSMLKEAND
jgi:predicted small metal-binding protein